MAAWGNAENAIFIRLHPKGVHFVVRLLLFSL